MSQPSPAAQESRARLHALDVFRGATIALMILVNNPGDWKNTFAPLLHAEWHGCTPTDLVFPFFLFIVGVAIPFALGPRRANGTTAGLVGKITRRALILFSLGMLGTLFPFYTVVLERVRIPGVLQRIAVVYLVAALVYLFLSPRWRLALSALLLGGYWALMQGVPVAGHGAGDLSPHGNLAFWLDHQLLGAHTWRNSPGPGDPEGILSTLPAIVTALLGIAVGELLRRDQPASFRLRQLLVLGVLLVSLGASLTPFFPFNKNLWSPTFTLFTAGLATLCLAATWWRIDLEPKPWTTRWSRPFTIFGQNSILAFVGSGLLTKLLVVVLKIEDAGTRVPLQKWLYAHFYQPFLPAQLASLAWALTLVLLWLGILTLLDRKGIHLKV